MCILASVSIEKASGRVLRMPTDLAVGGRSRWKEIRSLIVGSGVQGRIRRFGEDLSDVRHVPYAVWLCFPDYECSEICILIMFAGPACTDASLDGGRRVKRGERKKEKSEN
ncbi:hypothetical protein MRX96_005740 [Rhipicephalus microplus]